MGLVLYGITMKQIGRGMTLFLNTYSNNTHRKPRLIVGFLRLENPFLSK